MKDVVDVQTRNLYEEVFSEDEQAFVEYYYQYKLQDNKIFQIMKDGKSVAMIHLNPFILNIGTTNDRILEKIFYIVAVATQKEYRHQGMMDNLLHKSILYMKEQGCPFTFLMPANPKIYTPYQFTYIYERVDYTINWDQIKDKNISYRSATDKDWHQLVEFSKREQEIQYHVYINKNIEYYKRIKKELISQGGNIYVLYEENNLIGYTFTANDKKEQWIQEALIGKAFTSYELVAESNKKKPVIMARIISLEKIMKWIKIKKNRADEIIIKIDVIDPLLLDNNGIFIWTINKEGSVLQRFTEAKEGINQKSELKIKIEEFTTFLFGYVNAEVCFPDAALDIIEKLHSIQVLEKVIINEIV